MGAQLASTVYLADPDTRQTVKLEPGTLPEPRLAALVTNPGAWVDRKLPRLPKAPTGGGPSGSGPDGASGDASDNSGAADTLPEEAEPAGDASEGTKPAAKKAATRPARGRRAAAEGDGGQ